MQTSYMRFVVVLAASLGAFTMAAAAPAPPPDPFSLLRRGGGYLLIGGGVATYLDRNVRGVVEPSGTWDVRLGLGSRRVVAGEFAYVGSAGSAGAFGKYLGFEGVEAVMRLQYPRQRGNWLAEPFVFGGAGWSHFEIVKATRLALRDTNELLVLPLGAGIGLGNGPSSSTPASPTARPSVSGSSPSPVEATPGLRAGRSRHPSAGSCDDAREELNLESGTPVRAPYYARTSRREIRDPRGHPCRRVRAGRLLSMRAR